MLIELPETILAYVWVGRGNGQQWLGMDGEGEGERRRNEHSDRGREIHKGSEDLPVRERESQTKASQQPLNAAS